jgi:hypothetical protein
VHQLQPRQLQVFDALGRDDRGWVLSVAHVAGVAPAALDERSSHPLGPLTRTAGWPMTIAKSSRWPARMCAHGTRTRVPDRLLGDSFTCATSGVCTRAIMDRSCSATPSGVPWTHICAQRGAVAAGWGRRELLADGLAGPPIDVSDNLVQIKTGATPLDAVAENGHDICIRGGGDCWSILRFYSWL